MKRRRIFLFSAGLVVAFVLAFFLQDVVRRAVVNPLAYVWWLLNLAVSAFPQLLFWILLIVTLILILTSSLSNWYSGGTKYEKLSRKHKGPVELVSGVISRSRKGNYSKWVLANRLGRILQEWEGTYGNNHPLLREKDKLPDESGEQKIRQYLQAGLNESFVDYPQPKLTFMRRKTTPFDLDVKEAIEYLESRMKDKSGNP